MIGPGTVITQCLGRVATNKDSTGVANIGKQQLRIFDR